MERDAAVACHRGHYYAVIEYRFAVCDCEGREEGGGDSPRSWS